MMFEIKRAALRSLLFGQDGTSIIPGAHDALSALMLQKAGYPALYIGSYSASAGLLASPDAGQLTLTEMVDLTRRIVDAVDVPVIADAEGGFGNAANVGKTVRAFENAGASAIHIEDHIFGKHTNESAVIASVPAAVGKIKAALDARQDSSFMIIARTDVAWARADSNEVVDRLNAFSDAGADLLMPAGISTDMLASIRNQIRGRVVITGRPGQSKQAERDAGANAVLYFSFSTLALLNGMERAIAELAQAESVDGVISFKLQEADFEALIGYEAFIERVQRYGAGT